MLQKRTEHIYNKKHLSQATITYSHNFRKKKLRSSWDGPLAQSANSSMFSQQCIARFHTECQLKDTSKEIVEQKYWDEAFNIPPRPGQKPEPSVKIPDESKKEKKKLMHTTRWTPRYPRFCSKKGGSLILQHWTPSQITTMKVIMQLFRTIIDTGFFGFCAVDPVF